MTSAGAGATEAAEATVEGDAPPESEADLMTNAMLAIVFVGPDSLALASRAAAIDARIRRRRMSRSSAEKMLESTDSELAMLA